MSRPRVATYLMDTTEDVARAVVAAAEEVFPSIGDGSHYATVRNTPGGQMTAYIKVEVLGEGDQERFEQELRVRAEQSLGRTIAIQPEVL